MKRNGWKRVIAALAALCLLLPLMTGFAESADEQEKLSGSLTIYAAMHGAEQFYQRLEDHIGIQKISEMCGVDLTFISPPTSGSVSSADLLMFFNTLIASGDYPDIFISTNYEWDSYPGGIDGAAADGILMPIDQINELIDTYGVNYNKLISDYGEEEIRMLKTDGGQMMLASMGSDMANLVQHTGMIIRKDWLDALNLEAPRTFDELTNVLRAFKTEMGADIPMAIPSLFDFYIRDNTFFSSAFGVTLGAQGGSTEGFLVIDGQVTHSYLQPGYKDVLALLRGYMEEGLIDIDSINRTAEDCRKLMFSGRSGVAPAGNWETIAALDLGKKSDPNFEIAPLRAPRLSDPDQQLKTMNILRRVSPGAKFTISSKCQDPVLAMKFIDFLYKPEVNLISVFSVGELPDGNTTYVVDENGEYSVSDYVLHNPDIPYSTLRAKYELNIFRTRTLDSSERALYYAPINAECWAEWGYNVDASMLIPKGTSPTAEESAIIVNVKSEMDTLVSEAVYKIICGDEPLDTWDSYVEKIRGLGIDDAIAAYQSAVDRFNAR